MAGAAGAAGAKRLGCETVRPQVRLYYFVSRCKLFIPSRYQPTTHAFLGK